MKAGNQSSAWWGRVASVVLVFSVLSGAPSGANDPDPPTRPEALMAVLRGEHEVEHFDGCGTAPKLLLNEVCSVGTECDEDVRIADFIEVYNPTGQQASLSCYVVAGDEDLPFVPRGELGARGLVAWGEEELGFRVAKKRDQVRLYRMLAVDGVPRLEVLDEVEIGEGRGLAYRSPDGGSWVTFSALDAESDRPASYGQSNP